MTDVTLVLGEWDTPEAGLRGHLQCSTDIFTGSSAQRFAASLKVRLLNQHLSVSVGVHFHSEYNPIAGDLGDLTHLWKAAVCAIVDPAVSGAGNQFGPSA